MPTGKNKFIVQQCCGTCTQAAGLSAAIAKKYPSLNPYKSRVPIGRTHTATMETRNQPGTAKLFTDPTTQTNMICLFGQYGTGKPSQYKDSFITMDDSAATRETYFKQALEDMARQIPSNSTLYIPYGIGCGLAGGNWTNYERMLKEFSTNHPDITITVVKLKE